jgi:radical SAM-linked protein
VSPVNNPLPWDHLDCGIDKSHFAHEYELTFSATSRKECTRKICKNLPGTCIKVLNEKKDVVTTDPDTSSIVYPKTFGETGKTKGRFPVRCTFRKLAETRYLSHLEMSRLIHQSVNRAGIHVKYSEGFNPKPKIAYFSPLPVGTESVEEYLEMELTCPIQETELLKLLNRTLPANLQFIKAEAVKPFEKSLHETFSAAHYTVTAGIELFPGLDSTSTHTQDFVREKVEQFLARESILYEKTRKKKNRTINIRPNIVALLLRDVCDDILSFELTVNLHASDSVRPEEIMVLFLGIDKGEIWQLRICRTGFS